MAKRPSILEVCVRRLGVHRGAMAAARTAQYAIAAHDLGHLPTTVEYAQWWAVDERTAWRHRASIRAAFGDDWQAVVEQVVSRIGERRSPRDVMNLAAPALATV